ncbi:MAG: hypothetical protein Q8Q09_09920 [Deltaproteobacteria bacterium]|nr:hypothetical protein [Deltaproteobacteria bacterium]
MNPIHSELCRFSVPMVALSIALTTHAASAQTLEPVSVTAQPPTPASAPNTASTPRVQDASLFAPIENNSATAALAIPTAATTITLAPRPFVGGGWIALAGLGGFFTLGGLANLGLAAHTLSTASIGPAPASLSSVSPYFVGAGVSIGAGAAMIVGAYVGITGNLREIAAYNQNLTRAARLVGEQVIAYDTAERALRSRVHTATTWTNVVMGAATLGTLGFMFAFQDFNAGILAFTLSYPLMAMLVTPLVVTLVGNAAGGRGSFGAALLGGFIGFLVPVGGNMYGATAGYMTSHDGAQETMTFRAPQPTVQLGATPQGIALSGTF